MSDKAPPGRNKALVDTGVCARKVLGFDYDRDEDTGKITRPGGIYTTGAHQQMVEFFDRSDIRYKQLMCPRGARKTSLITAFCVRHILANPNIRILYSMQTMSEAKQTLAAVRAVLESEKVTEWYGPQKGSLWRDYAFTVKTRTDVAMREPTMKAGGLEKRVTGIHPDIIILDDLVDWTNVRTVEGIDKQITYLKLCFPLLESGGQFLDVGTVYDEADVHHYIRDELGSQFESIWLTSGMDVITNGDGTYDLEGGPPTFPHQSEEYLRGQLERMGPTEFEANYNMRCASPEDQLFFRNQFHSEKWNDRMRRLSGYILTDTATSEGEQSSYSVIAVVLLSFDNVAYLADLRVGLWQPTQFVDHFLETVLHWRGRCRLHAQVFENVALNHVYKASIETEARLRQVPLNLVGVSRGTNRSKKDERIKSLQYRFANKQFYVLDTVPRNCTVRGKIRRLWRPDGFMNEETGKREPDGILVDHFIRPNAKKKDIADALADLEAIGTDGRRICSPSPSPPGQDHIERPYRPTRWSKRRRKVGWDDLAVRSQDRKKLW